MKYGIEVFSPFKPMLLERCKIEDVGKFFTGRESYFVQTKHDGERFQIHMQDGRFKYFSRNAYDFTENYGETESSGKSLYLHVHAIIDFPITCTVVFRLFQVVY